MNRKEWLEVGRQSLYFVLAAAGMALLVRLMDSLQGKPLEGEKLVIILALWILVFAMFMGLTPFAMDARQKGMEYLLTLPFSRRRLLLIKFLPRLAAITFFFLVFFVLYGLVGQNAFAGGFPFFGLAYFALFLISFSLSLTHENFIVQSLWAGAAWCGCLLLSLFIVTRGFVWKFRMPASWIDSNLWGSLAYDAPTLLSSAAVFLLLAASFPLSLFLAIRRFDLKPARVFNRRQLLIFVPLLLLSLALSLGITYHVQKRFAYQETNHYILDGRQVLKAELSGVLTLYGEGGRRRLDTKRAASWDRLLLEVKGRLYLSGYDVRDGSRFIGRLELNDLSWKVLHRCPGRDFVASAFFGFHYDGDGFVYLRRSRARSLGADRAREATFSELELVSLDMAGHVRSTIVYRSPLFRKHYQPRFIGGGRMNGRRFWIIGHQWQNVLRILEDGRVEDLGRSAGHPAYCRGLLFTIGEGSLQVRRLLDGGSETIREIPGHFKLPWSLQFMRSDSRVGEIYAVRGKQLVHIDLATLAVTDIGPLRGRVRMVPPGDFYYIEAENWPGLPTDGWKRLYRLQGGKMVLLKQFDFKDSGYGWVWVEEHGVTLYQRQGAKARFFAFPDLRELQLEKMR